MEIQISTEELKTRKLFLATPMFGGQCSGMFTRSVADLTALCAHYGIQIRCFFLFNESLIPRARNYACSEFLRSGDTHMMFIDGDIGFDPRDVIAMLALQSPNPADDPYDVLAGPYPKKNISWEKIVTAVNKGMADQDPNQLDKYVGDYVFNPVGGATKIPLSEPAEVLEAGTGFMMIRRATFEKFEQAYPQQRYRPDHIRTANFDGSKEITAFFDCPIDGKRANIVDELRQFIDANPSASPEELYEFVKDPRNSINKYSDRYLSEDYMFAQWVRKAGMKVWLCPWMKLQHVGMYVFGGSLVDIAQIGAAATADPSLLKKKR